MVRKQYCFNCGEFLGEFEHSNRLDGPLSCGKAECERAGAEEERSEREYRRQSAEEDDFNRY